MVNRNPQIPLAIIGLLLLAALCFYLGVLMV